MAFDPASLRGKLKSFLFLVFVVAFALPPRAIMLFTTDRYADSDESIVGLMGKHIYEGEKIPFFFYGQSYGGGHVIEALPVAAWRHINNKPSAAAIKAVPIFFSILVIYFVFIFMYETCGPGAGILSTLLLGYSTPFLKSSLKADGYIETIFFGVFAFVMLARAEKRIRGNPGARIAALLFIAGFSLALSVWSYDFGIVYFVIFTIFAAIHFLRGSKRIAAYLSGVVAGASPLIAANLTGGFSHLRHFVSGGPGGEHSIAAIPANIAAVFSKYLPAFFTHECVHNFVLPPPWQAWPVFTAVVISMAAMLNPRWKKNPVIILIPLVFIAAFSASGYFGRSPRYLLPLEPFISICVVTCVHYLSRSRESLSRFAGVAILCLYIAGTVPSLINLFKDNSIVEGNVKTKPGSLVRIADYLERKGIDCVNTTYFIKWRLLFLTDERINAVDMKAAEREESYLRYEEAGCPADAPPSFVFHKNSPYIRSILRGIDTIRLPYAYYRSSDHVALIPVSLITGEQ